MSGLSTAEWVASACCWASLGPSGSRWLRVAQREHYLPGSAIRFARRWWVGVRVNIPLLGAGVLAAALAWPFPLVALATAAVAIVAPLGLSVRGRTSPLGLTRRLRTLAALWVVIEGAAVAIGVAVGRPAFFSACGALLTPLFIDLGCLVTRPLEQRLASRFVAQAARRLESVHPIIVGITGSYGKTSTKNYVSHLLAGTFRVVASPASFNNRAGLARAVNEQLADGTEVFIAEMGTYGPGEIAELCSWCPPDVAVITAIGPVHLERFGSEEAILEAKTEITECASTVVLNVDNPRLAGLAETLGHRESPPTVLRCSGKDKGSDTFVGAEGESHAIWLSGGLLDRVLLHPSVRDTNLACAIAVAKHLGVPPATLVARIADLPDVEHRLTVGTSRSGVIVIDDTFNSNPVGARSALGVLNNATSDGRRVVVTPGMVELGPRQFEENRLFAQASAEITTDLLVVGRTNRSALVSGSGDDRTITFRTREEAVQWVRDNLGSGDAVLYENDLPDHYP